MSFFPATKSGCVFGYAAASSLQKSDGSGGYLTAGSGDAIDRIFDESGNGNHAIGTTTTRPLVYTSGGAHFDAVDDFLLLPTVTVQQIIFVCTCLSGEPILAGYMGQSGTDFGIRRGTDGAHWRGQTVNDGDFTTGASPAEFRVDDVVGEAQSEGSVHVVSAIAASASSAGWNVGYYSPSASRACSGVISAMAVYSSALSNSDRQAVQSWLLSPSYGNTSASLGARGLIPLSQPLFLGSPGLSFGG